MPFFSEGGNGMSKKQGDHSHIRNFCIIAHIDHGKSTLADRLLEYTGTLSEREMVNQVLDSMDIERERGITIKAQAVRLSYKATDNTEYELNLIDTPGHVDFTYEVSRSLAACEGAILVIDATQGVEAQTLANVYLALEHDLEIIPVINKIDLPAAQPDAVKLELADLGIDPDEAIVCSAKTGEGIPDVLEAVVERVPAPTGDLDKPLKALVFDSNYDPYLGVVAYVRIMDGMIKPGMKMKLMASDQSYDTDNVGIFAPTMTPVKNLGVGEVGYVTGSIKDVKNCRVGDTITDANNPAQEPLPGYQQVKPMVFSGLYPVESADYEELREALEKLQLNDASFVFEPEVSEALGFGFRCGFLGLLHMDVIQERLEREYNLDLVMTAPSVVYRLHLTDGTIEDVDNPALFPEKNNIQKIEEPYTRAMIKVPENFVGQVMELCQERRGTFKDMQYLNTERVNLIYDIPLSELIIDFFDQLKSRTKGYATLDYELTGYVESNLIKLDIIIAGKVVDALSIIVHEKDSLRKGQNLCRKLKQYIHQQLFEVPIQAAVGSKIIARVNIKARRKNVLAKCYGGDITRKKKLLEKQKEGKKRMKAIGNVEVPQEAFMAVLKLNEDD